MAHNLNFNRKTGRYSFFSVKEKAWHGLGKIVEQYPTSAEAIEFAGLNYDIRKKSNIHRISYDIETISDNSFFTYRTDTNQVLGDKIGADYAVIQNREAFAFFDAIVGGGEGILYETAGALGHGYGK